MSRTGDNEVGPSTAQVSFDFGNPTQMPCNCQTTSAPFYFCVHSHGLIVARNKGKRAIDKREQPLYGARPRKIMRPIWKGSISFGLVYIPIAVYPATREEKLSFRQLRATDLSPIR